MSDEETPGKSNLGGSEPDTLSSIHQFDHAFGDRPDFVGEINGFGFGFERLSGVELDAEFGGVDGHLGIVCPWIEVVGDLGVLKGSNRIDLRVLNDMRSVDRGDVW